MKFKNLISKDLSPNDLIEPNYNGELPRQMPIYLEIDPEAKTVDVFAANFKLNGIPSDIWYDRRFAIDLPFNVDASLLSDFVDVIADRIDQFISKWELVYNGQNYVGSIDSDFLNSFEHEVYQTVPTNDSVEFISPVDYFDAIIYRRETSVKIQDIETEITSETSDEELEAIAKQLENDLCDPVVFDGSIIDMLIELRDDCEE